MSELRISSTWMYHPAEAGLGVQNLHVSLTSLTCAAVSKDKKPVLVDAAGIHEHGHGRRADLHIIRPKLLFSSTKLVVDTCLEHIDSFWKETQERPRDEL